MKFTKVKDNRTGIQYDWMADIRSFQDLMEIEESFTTRDAWCIVNYLGSKDYANDVNDSFEGNPISRAGKDHCHPQNKLASFLSCCVRSFPEKTEIRPLFYFSGKLSQASISKVKYILAHERILVNKNGGFFTWNNDLIETDTIEAYRFPQYDIKDIKVSKWPEGKHWYITCNGISVIVDGNEKWKLEENAWDAAKRWLKDNSGK